MKSVREGKCPIKDIKLGASYSSPQYSYRLSWLQIRQCLEKIARPVRLGFLALLCSSGLFHKASFSQGFFESGLLSSQANRIDDSTWCEKQRPISKKEQAQRLIHLSDEGAEVNIARYRRHELALKAAQAVYQVPDLETKIEASEFLAQFSKLVEVQPEGYELYHSHADPLTGMKYAIFAPLASTSVSDNKPPWVFAISGTQTTIDWAANLNLGLKQFESLSGLIQIFLDCQTSDEYGAPLVSREWIVTGHSLGGGLAQVLAFLIQKSRMERNLRPMDIDLVTWNAFGAQELLAKVTSADLDPLAFMKVANYYVKGDPVSRIGRHIGRTFELRPKDSDLEHLSLAQRILYLHSHELIDELVGFRFGSLNGLAFSSRQSPPTFEHLSALTRYGGLFSDLPKLVFHSGRRHTIKVIGDALEQLADTKLNQVHEQLALKYLLNVAVLRVDELEEAGDAVMAAWLSERITRVLEVKGRPDHEQ